MIQIQLYLYRLYSIQILCRDVGCLIQSFGYDENNFEKKFCLKGS